MTRSLGDSDSLPTRRSFLDALGAVVTTAGCVRTDAEPTGSEITVEWEIDLSSDGDYEHIRTLRDEQRGWTSFEVLVEQVEQE